ncbi:hypothetical protein [Jiangella alba]|uniref:Major capsid and protease fusion protein n=1 Tax=Jiangella alba TaxID=561176 RepID=A0A1H5PLD6_9ACTN|nr:hypothetical protein [Jiangella alba]SEF13787.1 hypothetical protein SAMN04488561_4474 [Jiangella alba]
MTTITAYGTLLTADADTRTLTYRILPYGEEGRTNVGKVTASKGVLTLPSDPGALVGNLEHDRKRPVAKGVTLTEDEDGLTASFRVANTTAGNDLLTEATEGLRTGASVEIDEPVIRAGRLVGGALSGVGFVTTPAFPSAQLVAEDAGELPEEEETPAEDEPEETPEGDQPEDTPEEESDDMTGTATAPADLRASAAGGGRRLLGAKSTPVDVFRLLANYGQTRDPQLLAALSDITQSGINDDIEVPQWVGELWDGVAYTRRIVPLFGHANLTAAKIAGWRWVTKPTMAPYTGNKTAVPSNQPTTEAVEIESERIAGAHDIDRKFRDFSNEGFWASYYAAMTESYAVQSDAFVLAEAKLSAVGVTPGAVPSGVSAVWGKIVDGALAVLTGTNAPPTFAVLAKDMYREFLLTPQEKGLEYLDAALGLEEGTAAGFRVVPNLGLDDGEVLVGVSQAATVHELSEVPVRAEALNIANAGVDAGMFGYIAVNVHKDAGLALVDPSGS